MAVLVVLGMSVKRIFPSPQLSSGDDLLRNFLPVIGPADHSEEVDEECC